VRQPSARRVTFIGGLHWPPNAEGLLWLVREVWPLVQQQRPDACLTVIGKDPPAELLNPQLKAQFPGLEVTGYVDDPLPYLQDTAVSVVPLHAGGGMRVKILEAWGWALPIVSTTIGAEGLAYRHEDNLLIADSAPAFAQAILRLLTDPDTAQRIARSGRQTVEDRYDWHKIYRTWNQVYTGR
jgi:glycosyltransferase involved in cell wall biosynthesis